LDQFYAKLQLLSLIFINIMVHLENVLLYRDQWAARQRLSGVLEIGSGHHLRAGFGRAP